MNILLVGAGGFIGSVARYGLSLVPAPEGFPWMTLLTNVAGAFLIGLVAQLASAGWGLMPQTTLFLKTGVCGGFTTFSTFSLESQQLLASKAFVAAGLYMVVSVVLCVLGVVLGQALAALLVRGQA